MKNLIYIIALCFVSHLALAQTTTENYIKNTTPQTEVQDQAALNALSDDDKIESITYFDGLGRPIQSIAKQAGGNKQDIITPFIYDEFGRQLREYLPYSRSTTSLDLDVGLLPVNGEISLLNTQYLNKFPEDLNGAVNPYSEKRLEDSPIGRVLQQSAPGSEWSMSNSHTIRFDYSTNSLNQLDPFNHANNSYDNVIHFDVLHPNNNTEETELIYSGHYASNELYKTITKDENWVAGKDHTTEEFKNNEGQIILKRTYNNEERHDTYYVYDDFGNLTYVLPPTATDEMLIQSSTGRAASITNYSWVQLAKVDSNFAEEYNRLLQDYDNSNLLNADINNAYGGQGGFSVNTFDDSEEVIFSINFSSLEPLELQNGELISLRDYGTHRDTELGRISGTDYSYIFSIRDNAIHVQGSGKLNGINEVFNSNTTLDYDQRFLWAHFVDIDSRFADDHEGDVLEYASTTNQDPLNVYLNNIHGGQGGLNVTVDENDLITLSFNINTTSALSLKQGVVLNLGLSRRLENQYLGTISDGTYNYDFELQDNNIVVTGSGLGNSFGGIFFPNAANTSPLINTNAIEGSCYIYHYDKRNRLIEKKIPGKGWEYIVYNKLDQPVLTQDAKQRINKDWNFMKYDVFGRVVYTGIHKYASASQNENAARLELQADLNSQSLQFEARGIATSVIGGITIDYTNQSLPNTNLELLTVNYYDSYNNLGLSADLIKNHGDVVYDNTIDILNVRSLATVNKVKVLDTNDWITSVVYYDDRAMPIYSVSKNDFLNTLDIIESDFDFVGKVLETKTKHIKDTNNPIIIEDYFTYDHSGRLLTQTQELDNSGQIELIINNHYDELGQLEQKNIGGMANATPEASTGLQTIDYDYNIRGWLKSINTPSSLGTDLFAFEIDYNNPQDLNKALFNGNISETSWITANDNKLRGYDYTYDALNRIKTGRYLGNHTLVGNPNVTENYDLSNVNYDKVGNITSLRRIGLVTGSYLMDVIDDLNYTYQSNSNKLIAVSDNGSKDGFIDGNLDPNDYLYDVNGNMIQDLNKGILNIDYNHLNLPTYIEISSSDHEGNISYIYDANGIKLRKIVSSSSITDYAGNFIYEDNGSGHQLKFFSHPEGYTEPTNLGYNYVYQYKDHLGNVRLSYSNPNNYQSLMNNAFYTDGDTDDINYFGQGGITVENGRLKVEVTNQFNGIRVPTDATLSPGQEVTVRLDIDTGNTNKIRMFMSEQDVNGNNIGSVVYYEPDASSGHHVITHTMQQGVRVSLGFDKSHQSNDQGTLTHFYLDNLEIISGTLEIIEENNYYPFGLKHKGYNYVVSANSNSVASKFMYNGKEFEVSLGWNNYHYGARFYDPAIAKWISIDALAERYYDQSSYNYVLNNPILYLDPDGNIVEMCCEELLNFLKKGGQVVYDNTIGLLEPVPIPEPGSMSNEDIWNSLGVVSKDKSVQEAIPEIETITSEDAPLSDKALAVIIIVSKLKPKGKSKVKVTTHKPKPKTDKSTSTNKRDTSTSENSSSTNSSDTNAKTSGKNGKHANQKAKQSATEKYNNAKAEYESLKSKPNKTKADKKAMEKARKQMNHWKGKADFSGETHSRNAKT